MRLEHPIFRSPLAPELELFDLPTPAGYRDWLDGGGVPATLAGWQVQRGEPQGATLYGVVVPPFGFEDSPDCEWVSSGVNSKGPTWMALGRQANWFLWGFAADPRWMTEGARQVFLNTIVWMDRFDGQAPLLHFARSGALQPRGREAPLIDIGLYGSYRESGSRMAARLRSRIPASVINACGEDVERMLENYRSRIEFVTSFPHTWMQDGRERKGVRLDFDPVLEAAGVSNRRPEFFAFLADRLGERGAEDADVRDLVDRYLPDEAPKDARLLAAWVAAHGDRLFFSDVYGYRWFVAPEPE